MEPPFQQQSPFQHQAPIPSPEGAQIELGPDTLRSTTPGRLRLEVPGFEGRVLEVQPPGMWSGVKVFLDNQEVKKKGMMPTYALQRSDGSETEAKFTGGFLAPKLTVEGRSFHLLKQLQWYEWAWAAWPIIFAFGGGCFPILIGLGVATMNAGIMRSERDKTTKYVLTGIINLVAVALFVGLIVAIVAAKGGFR
jgi:hypothetical protein